MKKKFSVKFILVLWLFFFLGFKNPAFSQTPNCWCSGSANICVTTAQELYDALYQPVPQSGQIIEICGTINLGDPGIDAASFPWVVPAEVTLRGNYNFVEGTRILFPYRYRGGITCSTQQRVVNGEVIQQHLPANEDEAIDLIMSGTGPELAFVFTMQEGCRFENICLQGPKADFKEQFMAANLNPLTDPLSTCTIDLNRYAEKEGLMAGLLMRGDNCNVTNSEVYGFTFFNILVRPEKNAAGDFWGHPTGRGRVNITNSLIGNNKIEEAK
ncbi:MAG TPA: hypothetical protein PKL45_15335, partial [Bacteroidia bacterium]|nr:hypothetical protein [Bacteroidia bacterium]